MVVVPRQTRQRAEILDLLEDVDEFRSAQQLHEMLRARGSSVGLATVYRAVQSLSEHGDVDVLRTEDGESVYRRCEQRSHHHHLVCRSCGRTVEIEAGQAEAWAAQVGAAHGFDDVDHTIELVGTCADLPGGRHRAGPPADRPGVGRSRPARRAMSRGTTHHDANSSTSDAIPTARPASRDRTTSKISIALPAMTSASTTQACPGEPCPLR